MNETKDVNTICKIAAKGMVSDILNTMAKGGMKTEDLRAMIADGIKLAISAYIECCKIRGIIPGEDYGVEF